MQRDSGSSVRIYNLAKGLAAAGNHVNVIMPKLQTTHEFVEGVSVNGFKGLSPRAMLDVLRRFANVTRPTSLYFYDPLFISRIIRSVDESDVVQIEQQSSGGLLIPLIKKVLRKPVVVDCHDVFQALRVQHTSTLRRMLETFLEKLVYKNADLLLVVSDNEKNFLISAGFGKRKIEVVPNGVDTKLYTKSYEQNKTREKYGLEGVKTVIFVGNLDYVANREAVQALSSVIAPKVLAKVKNAKFLVVGKSQARMELPGLTFTGFVDNLSDLLSVSDVAVAPLFHGSGTRLKILEYLSSSLPVVSTSIGAEGLYVKDSVNIFIEDDLENFGLRIIELLQDKNLATEIGKAGRELATSTYDWKRITHKLQFNLNRLCPGS